MKKSIFVLGATALLLTGCAPIALAPTELKPVAEAIQTTNESKDFVAPTKATLTLTQVFDMTMTGEEPESTNSVGKLAFDATTGYFAMTATEDGEKMEMYSYAKDGTYYMAMAEGEEKQYYAVPCGTQELAVTFAIEMLSQLPYGSIVATYAAGLTQLQSVIGFCDQAIVNGDEDPTNDVNNGYTDSYNLGITGSASGTSMDVTFTLNGSASATDEGYSASASINGVMKVKFENGYLTYSLDEATMLESATMEGETFEMRVYSKTETSISYGDVDYTYPDLTNGYTQMEIPM